ncbi:MAG: acyl--CoA ligase [Candidatus Eisenbacteria bacterium]|nr:acyl--CoA ligase [Candidatus Eisenbacteria bacterium]
MLQDLLADSARRLPDKVALVCDGQRLSYAELEARSNALAHALVRRGVIRGDRVVVFSDNTVQAVVAYWAILKANAVACMVNSQTRIEKLTMMLADCGAAALVSDARHAATFVEAVGRSPGVRTVIVSGALDGERSARLTGLASWDDAVAEGPRDVPPARLNLDHDLSSIIYSSGTTGEPKAIMLSHRNQLVASASIAAYLENAESDVVLSVLPLALTYGAYQMIAAFRVGARLVLERSFAFPAQVLARMVSERVTGFAGVPMIFAVLLQTRNLADYDLSHIRYLTNAAAALPVPHLLRIRELMPKVRFFAMYGQTECARISYLPPEDIDRKPSSIGIPIPNTEFWVVNEAGGRAAPREIGELVVRGAHVMRGYWGRPEDTARKLRPGPIPGEFVLHTGDLCWLDEEGYLYFVSRMDDIIKSRGEKVSPREVENALAEIPGVAEAAVIGVPDDMLGQAVKAFVVPAEGVTLTEKQVKLECDRRLESFMVPKYVVFVPDLPRTSGGKVKKTELK